MDLKGKKVLLVGFVKIGIFIIKYLDKLGVSIIVNDIKDENKLRNIFDELKFINDIKYILGYYLEDVDDIDMVVVFLGVLLDLLFILKLKNLGKYIIGEVELVFKLLNNLIFIGIIGINGKIIIISLVGEIFLRVKWDIYVVGNIGNFVIDIIEILSEEFVLVIELSSF